MILLRFQLLKKKLGLLMLASIMLLFLVAIIIAADYWYLHYLNYSTLLGAAFGVLVLPIIGYIAWVISKRII